jgi:TRAP transporter 4TM/12TM fusion protein
MFRMHNIELTRIGWMMYSGESGLFGEITEVAATVISIFVIFGVFLDRSHAGRAFLNIVISVLGRMRGGPAKAAVFASAIFGTFSGSPSANVAATGAVTIPLMKSLGYPSEFAGGVEAASGCGGNFMPPVMGAAAFVMASWLGVPYYSVCIAAAFPAILYYVAIYVAVDAQSVKLGLRSLPREELPRFWPSVKEGWYWAIPIIVLLILLVVLKWSAPRAGFYAALSIFPLAFVRRDSRITWKRFADGCLQSVRTMIVPSIACGMAGVLMGAIMMTGVAIKLSSMLVLLAGGHQLLLLLLAAIVAYILGMGMASVAVYIVVAVLVAPALAQMGVPLLHSHLFVYYFGMLSHITPPVATASLVAAGMAGGSPFGTGFWAMRLAIVSLVVPFAFIYNPALLLQAPLAEIVRTVPLAIVGTIALGMGMIGQGLTRLNWLQRPLLMVGGYLMYLHAPEMYGVGTVIVAGVLAWHFAAWKLAKARKFATVPSIGP